MEIGDLTLHLNEQKVMRENQPVVLNATAFKILLVLAQAYPQPVSRSMLNHKIWGDNPPNTDALKSHIYNLRTGLDANIATSTSSSTVIKTITNIGYKLAIIDPGPVSK